MWLDDCRIPFVDTEDIDFNTTQKGNVYAGNSLLKSKTKRNTTHYKQQGRFTPNLLVCDDMLNDGTITKQSNRKYNNKVGGQLFYGLGENYAVGDKGTNSRYYNLDLWFDNMIDKL